MKSFLSTIDKSKIKDYLLKEKNSIIWYSFLIVLIEIVIARLFLDVSFMTNDDSGLQAALNGRYTGTPYPYHQFINVFLGLFLCELYNIIPCTHWWYIWSMFCLVSGLFMIHYTVLRNSPNKKCAIITIIIFAGIFELYCLTNISFTLVPIVFSLGAISLLFFKEDSYQWSWYRVGFVSIVLLIASLHRYYSALIMLCFFALGLFYYVLKVADRSMFIKTIKYIGTICATVILIFGASRFSSQIKEDLNGDYFTELNEYRGILTDYPRPSYEERPDVYEKYGWDKATYKLISSWCFMVDEYNLDALRGIVNDLELKGTFAKINDSSRQPIMESLQVIKNYFMIQKNLSYENIIKLTMAMFVVFSVIYLFFKKHISFVNRLSMFLCVGGSFLMLLYLIINGRPILRAMLCVIIPMIVIISLLYINELSTKNNCGESVSQKMVMLDKGITIAIVLLAVTSLISVMNIEKNNNDRVIAYSQYGNMNQDNIYVYTDASVTSTDIELFLPQNMIFWGGSAVGSHFYYEQMKNLGIDRLKIDTLNNENVYLIAQSINGQSVVVDLLKEKIGKDVNVECIDMINDETAVFKFSW